VHIRQVQQDFLLSLSQKITDGVAQGNAALAQGDTAAAIHNGHTIDLTRAAFHAHWEASLPPAASPWTCLTSLISVPVWDGLISTSSMNERIRKMPLPDVFNKFSADSGSGILAKSRPLPWSRMVITRSRPVFSKS